MHSPSSDSQTSPVAATVPLHVDRPSAAATAGWQRVAHRYRVVLAPLRRPWHHRELLWELTRREILIRYRGSFLGLLWSFSQPLLMLAVYSLVFGFIFEAKWSATEAGGTPFALILFAGLIVYSLFAECANRAPTLVLAHPGYVKKVVFPLEILPCVTIASALFHAAVSLAVLVLVQSALYSFPGVALLTLPFVLLPVVLFTLGVSWFLAALGVYFRDAVHTVALFTTVVLFVSPVFYPMSALPEPLRAYAWLNPLALVIEDLRAVLFLAAMPRWGALAAASGFSLLIAAAGLLWFERTRPGFADVI